MNHLHTELKKLKSEFIEMAELVKSQVEKSCQSLVLFNKDLADEVVFNEKRVNAYELKIDKECENIFALFNPVANDLRFVFSTLKCNSSLERIGDNAEGIASFVLELEQAFDQKLMNDLQIDMMAAICNDMISQVIASYENNDPGNARTLFEMDIQLNELNNRANTTIAKYIQSKPTDIENTLRLLMLVKKLERTGDLLKSMAEEIIFYVEAKVIRHGNKAMKGL